MFQRDADQLAARAHAGLAEQLLQRSFDGTFADFQTLGDLLVGQTFKNAAQHLPVALGEAHAAEDLARRALDGGFGVLRVDPGLAGQHGAHGLEQHFGRIVLEEDAGHAVIQHLPQFRAGQPHRDDQNFDVQLMIPDVVHHLVAAAVAELVVEQDQVGRRELQLGQGFLDRGTLRHYLDPRLRREQPGQTLPKQRVIIDQ